MSEISAGGRCSEQKAKVRKRQMVWASSEDPGYVQDPCREGSPAMFGPRMPPHERLPAFSPSLSAEFAPYPGIRVLGQPWLV